jgi:hypothetical protein
MEPDPPPSTYGFAEFGVSYNKPIGESVKGIGRIAQEIKVRALTSVAPGFKPVTDAMPMGTRLWVYENGFRYDITSAGSGSPNARGFVPWASIFAIGTRRKPSLFNRDRQEMQIQYRFDPGVHGVLAMKIGTSQKVQFLKYARPRLRPDTQVAIQ